MGECANGARVERAWTVDGRWATGTVGRRRDTRAASSSTPNARAVVGRENDESSAMAKKGSIGEATRAVVATATDNNNAFMTRARRARVGVPGARAAYEITTSVREVFGHVSFLLLGYSYLTSDLMQLRALAVGGLSAAMVFQYFRADPLWLPIRWNALFVAINAIWVAKMWFDEREAERWCTAEERALYERHFSHMALADFRTLVSHGRWMDLDVGTEVTTEGKPNVSVCVIVQGDADVFIGGKRVNTIPAGNFIGEMSLMRSVEHGKNGKVNKEGSIKARAATATVRIVNRARVFQWDDGVLRRLLREDDNVKSGVHAAFGVGLAEKLLTTRVMSTKMIQRSPDLVRGALAQ